MQFVLTLIAGAGSELPDDIVGDVRQALNALGAETNPPDWLSQGQACDIAFDGLSPDQAAAAASHSIGELMIDCISQASTGRRKKLLLADMDSTFVTSETLDDLAAFAGLKDEIAAITARAMNGDLDFEEALNERVAMLKGMPETTLAEAYNQMELSPGAKTAVQTLSAHDVHCVLISGGFKFFTGRVATECGFHEDMANDFIIVDGVLTGSVTQPVLTKDVKLQTLISKSADLGVAMSDTAAIGDGANDLPMLKAAGLGIAYRGKPSVRAEISSRLDHADLTGLLFAQGYRADEFVTGAD